MAWVKGAIRCVVGGGLIQYTRQDLPGYLDDDDGIRTFYPDGHLETLACYREGKSVGWQPRYLCNGDASAKVCKASFHPTLALGCQMQLEEIRPTAKDFQASTALALRARKIAAGMKRNKAASTSK